MTIRCLQSTNIDILWIIMHFNSFLAAFLPDFSVLMTKYMTLFRPWYNFSSDNIRLFLENRKSVPCYAALWI